MRPWVSRGVVMLAGLVLLAVPLFMGVGSKAAPAAAQDEGSLARRLLGPPGNPGAAQLLPGAIPSNLPLSLPVPQGASVVGTLYLDYGGGAGASRIVMDAPYTPQDVGAFYEANLPGLGWNPPPLGPDGPKGVFCQSASGPLIAINAFPMGDNASDVRVDILTGEAGQCPTQQQGPPPQGR